MNGWGTLCPFISFGMFFSVEPLIFLVFFLLQYKLWLSTIVEMDQFFCRFNDHEVFFFPKKFGG